MRGEIQRIFEGAEINTGVDPESERDSGIIILLLVPVIDVVILSQS